LKVEPVNLVLFVNALTNESTAPHAHGEASWWDTLEGWF
jgi:protein SCO1/2